MLIHLTDSGKKLCPSSCLNKSGEKGGAVGSCGHFLYHTVRQLLRKLSLVSLYKVVRMRGGV